jgi:hypothetical protein
MAVTIRRPWVRNVGSIFEDRSIKAAFGARLLALAVTSATLVSFLEAPFIHVHEHERDPFHAGGPVHTHGLAGHGGTGLERAHTDSDAHYLSSCAWQTPDVAAVHPALDHFELAPPDPTSTAISFLSHTTPAPQSLGPPGGRAPPADYL